MTDEPNNSKPETPNPEQFLTPGRFAVVLALLLAVTFWRVLLGGEAFFYRDYGFLGYPFAHFHRECFWSGDFFPLWNPYVNCGAPFLAQWNTLCLYPGALIYLLLPLPWSLGFFCVVHLFLGGMGMRALAERWTGSPFGAAVAGVAFVFSGLVLGCVIYPNYLVALGWMPWVVLAARRAWQEGGRRLVIAALVGGMQMLTGAPEIILLTWGLLVGLLVTEVFSVQCSVFSKGTKSSAPLGQPEAKTEHGILNTDYFPALRRFLSVIALITGLCAAQLLPFFQLLSLSQRSGDAVNTFWSLPGWGWVNLFFPLFRNFQTEQGVWVMIGQSFFPSVYLGIVPLTLAGLAVWGIGLRRAEEQAAVGQGVLASPSDTRTPLDLGGALGTARPTSAVWEVRLLAGATLLAVLLAMGDNFILWRWLREVLPLGVMRFPVKALLLAGFTVPLLAGFGAAFISQRVRQVLHADFSPADGDSREAILKRFSRTGFWKGWLVVLGVVTALLAVSYLVAVRFPLMKLDPQAALQCVELRTGVLWWGAVAFIGVAFAFGQRIVAGASVLLVGVMALDGAFHCGVLNPTIPAGAFEPGLAAAYHASKGALTPAPKLGESRIMLSPQAERALHTRMVPKFYDDFIGQRLAFWGNLNLLDGLPKVNGASTLVTREWNDVEYFLYGTTNPAPANLMDFLGVTYTTKAGELMQWERRTNAMPLVSFPAEAVEATEPGQALKAMRSPDWDPERVAFVARQPVEGSHGMKWNYGLADIAALIGTARIASLSPTHLELDVTVNAAHGLVVAQNFYPGWRATVNGQPAPVLRANHAFQAVPIPAGKSTVRLDLVSWPFRIGVGISLLTLAGCALWWRRVV